MKQIKQLFFVLLCITQIYAPAHALSAETIFTSPASTCSTYRREGNTHIHDVSVHNVKRCDDINRHKENRDSQMSFEITNGMKEKVYVRINSTIYHARAVTLNPGQTAVVYERTNYRPAGMTGLVLGADKSKNRDLKLVNSIGNERHTKWLVTNDKIKKR